MMTVEPLQKLFDDARDSLLQKATTYLDTIWEEVLQKARLALNNREDEVRMTPSGLAALSKAEREMLLVVCDKRFDGNAHASIYITTLEDGNQKVELIIFFSYMKGLGAPIFRAD